MDSKEDQQRDQFFRIIQPHMEGLNEFVRSEIEYQLATGDLKSDELTSEDVVDTVMLQAFEEYQKEEPKLPLDRWLVMLAIRFIRNETRWLRQDRDQFVHLEEDIPEISPAEEVNQLGSETLYFHQPDEDLQMEDIVADPLAETPEQVAEMTDEVRQLAKECLSELPREWRDAFVLRRVQGFSIKEIAEITRRNEAQVRKDLEQAESCVNKKVDEFRLNVKK
jgi:RNA polymerase sigma factor (sigma-70 family)